MYRYGTINIVKKRSNTIQLIDNPLSDSITLLFYSFTDVFIFYRLIYRIVCKQRSKSKF